MKIDRLISIIMVLLDKKRISAPALAKMFEVSVRTIYRDIDSLNRAGIPVTAWPGVSGGIGIMENFKLDRKLMTPSDLAMLLSGLSSISSAFPAHQIAKTLAKVKGLLPENEMKQIELEAERISVDLSTWAGGKAAAPALEKIKSAMRESRLVEFTYYGKEGRKSRRRVEPYRLVLKESSWYLQGWCTARRDFRVFRLSRMAGIEVTPSAFNMREFRPMAMDGSDFIGGRIITITLLVDLSLRERIAERCPEGNIHPQGKNRMLVDFPFAEDEMGYELLLSFGDRCECLAPEHVRRALAERIRRMQRIYGSI